MSDSHWNNNELQFARLLWELDAAGAFTDEVIELLCRSMDLGGEELTSLLNRAIDVFEEDKRLFFEGRRKDND